jgi:hypothetical protein
MKVYFAHPISSYRTEQEAQIIRALEDMGLIVINPSDRQHQDAVEEIQAQYAHDRNEGSRMVMEYFVKVCNACDGCVMLTFPDGSLGAGIVKEVQSFLDKGKKVQEVSLNGDGQISLRDVPDLSGYTCLGVEPTRAMLRSLRSGPVPKP